MYITDVVAQRPKAMDAEQWNRVNAVLDAAMALPADKREGYLKTQCGDDPDLLGEVRALLQAQDEVSSNFLEMPAGAYAASLVPNEEEQGDPMVGRKVDDYEILDVLGQGGMGVVYKARHLTLNRIEALKVITPYLVRDPQFLRRFELEAQALARFQHANIVTVYTLRQSELGHYLTMEYVEGETLGDVIAEQGALPWKRALPIIKQLLSAFEYAHERGIIHRDIKPRNIMLTPEGTVKVMDFGLAKFYQRNDVTQTQGLSGTLCYMAPEQILGTSRLDQRSDLFSLGLTMYELLSGRLPFDKTDSQFSIQRIIVEDAFAPPRQFNAAVPTRLSSIIMKTLEKKPAQRYQYAREMLADIDAFERDVTVTDVQETQIQQPPAYTKTREAGGRPLLRRAGMIAGALLLTAGLVWAAVWGPAVIFGDDAVPEQGLTSIVAEHEQPEDATTEQGLVQEDGGTPLNTLDEIVPDSPPTLPDPKREQSTTSARPTETATQQQDDPVASAQQPTSNPAETTELADQNTEQQNTATTDEPQQPAGDQPETTPPAEETPPAPSAAEVVRDDARNLRTPLKEAIIDNAWLGIPDPIAAFYKDKLDDMPRAFRITGVGVEIDDSRVQVDGPRARLQVTVYIEYQQRGRDGKKSLPIPSVWQWQEVDGRMTLVNVEDA